MCLANQHGCPPLKSPLLTDRHEISSTDHLVHLIKNRQIDFFQYSADEYSHSDESLKNLCLLKNKSFFLVLLWCQTVNSIKIDHKRQKKKKSQTTQTFD